MRHYTFALLMIGLAAVVAACDTRDETEGVVGERTAPATEEMPPAQAPGETVEEMPPAQPPGEAEPGTEVEQVAGREEPGEAAELVQEAAATVRKMKSDSELKKLLSQSKGVFIVPTYGRGAVGVGARGGEGVLLAHQAGKWSDPVFYDLGGISVGAQFGGEGGEIAMLLMSEQALDSFKGDNTFSLNADAKLTIVDYSGLAEASLGKDAGDVIFWSDTEGAFAGVALSATDISWDDEENPAYYKKGVTAQDILSGKVTGPKGQLHQELSGI